MPSLKQGRWKDFSAHLDTTMGVVEFKLSWTGYTQPSASATITASGGIEVPLCRGMCLQPLVLVVGEERGYRVSSP